MSVCVWCMDDASSNVNAPVVAAQTSCGSTEGRFLNPMTEQGR